MFSIWVFFWPWLNFRLLEEEEEGNICILCLPNWLIFQLDFFSPVFVPIQSWACENSRFCICVSYRQLRLCAFFPHNLSLEQTVFRFWPKSKVFIFTTVTGLLSLNFCSLLFQDFCWTPSLSVICNLRDAGDRVSRVILVVIFSVWIFHFKQTPWSGPFHGVSTRRHCSRNRISSLPEASSRKIPRFSGSRFQWAVLNTMDSETFGRIPLLSGGIQSDRLQQQGLFE